ncbi:hypothetical protein LIER_15204 [Lithospermum erythrorhizon]|uniref:Uncharacterized protein n=1 Tax=Lithospermum erythrorhizon TaxID=34254 RepID=A0AAV3Q613_LITER
MATPMTTEAAVGIGQNGGGIGSKLMKSLVDPLIQMFSFFHKAIRSELEGLLLAAMEFVRCGRGGRGGSGGNINSLVERLRFLRKIY